MWLCFVLLILIIFYKYHYVYYWILYIYSLSKFLAVRFTRHIYVQCCLTIKLSFKQATIKSFFNKSMIALFMPSQALGLIKVCNLSYCDSWIKVILLSFWLWFEFIVSENEHFSVCVLEIFFFYKHSVPI